MGDYGGMVENALRTMLLIGLALGAIGVIAGWAIWHFVLSHVGLSWN